MERQNYLRFRQIISYYFHEDKLNPPNTRSTDVECHNHCNRGGNNVHAQTL